MKPVARIDLAATREALVKQAVARAASVLASHAAAGAVPLALAVDAVRAEVSMATQSVLDLHVEVTLRSLSCPN